VRAGGEKAAIIYLFFDIGPSRSPAGGPERRWSVPDPHTLNQPPSTVPEGPVPHPTFTEAAIRDPLLVIRCAVFGRGGTMYLAVR
jgi:hypothetical protein